MPFGVGDLEVYVGQVVNKEALKKVSFLLDHGANVNACDMRGFTSLHRAAEVGYVEILKLLLEHGAEIEPIAQGITPRMLAEKNNRKEIIDFLDLFGSPHI
jgi:ankyrin repeat protein